MPALRVILSNATCKRGAPWEQQEHHASLGFSLNAGSDFTKSKFKVIAGDRVKTP